MGVAAKVAGCKGAPPTGGRRSAERITSVWVTAKSVDGIQYMKTPAGSSSTRGKDTATMVCKPLLTRRRIAGGAGGAGLAGVAGVAGSARVPLGSRSRLWSRSPPWA